MKKLENWLISILFILICIVGYIDYNMLEGDFNNIHGFYKDIYHIDVKPEDLTYYKTSKLLTADKNVTYTVKEYRLKVRDHNKIQERNFYTNVFVVYDAKGKFQFIAEDLVTARKNRLVTDQIDEIMKKIDAPTEFYGVNVKVDREKFYTTGKEDTRYVAFQIRLDSKKKKYDYKGLLTKIVKACEEQGLDFETIALTHNYNYPGLGMVRYGKERGKPIDEYRFTIPGEVNANRKR